LSDWHDNPNAEDYEAYVDGEVKALRQEARKRSRTGRQGISSRAIDVPLMKGTCFIERSAPNGPNGKPCIRIWFPPEAIPGMIAALAQSLIAPGKR